MAAEHLPQSLLVGLLLLCLKPNWAEWAVPLLREPYLRVRVRLLVMLWRVQILFPKKTWEKPLQKRQAAESWVEYLGWAESF